MKISERIAKLIDVKSIVTIVLTVIFGVLSLRSVISSEQFLTIFTVIISFYFGTQSAKNQLNKNENLIDKIDKKEDNNEPMPYTSIDKNVRDGIL